MAEQPRLKIAIADYGHTRALKSGAVAIGGIEPDFVQVTPIIGAFRRVHHVRRQLERSDVLLVIDHPGHLRGVEPFAPRPPDP